MVTNGETAGLRVLVADTDPGVRWAVKTGLERSGYTVSGAGSVSEMLRVAGEETPDVIITEILPEAGFTLEVLGLLLRKERPPKVICVSVETVPRMVIDCMQQGAADFVAKPFALHDIRASLGKVLDGAIPSSGRGGAGGSGGEAEDGSSFLVGISPAMQDLRGIIERIARTDLNCLVRGESGSGKDLVAREIHRLSQRRGKPLIKVNCTALPEHLLESELFGYEKGAFTGAYHAKPGRFELANGGVIFLDEIGDMHLNLQAKLLQVIEHKEFTKVGGRKAVRVDVQIIAATNADLEQKTKEGSFRDDLYFRLNEVSIWTPSLKERREDIPLLVRHFVQKHGRFRNGTDFEISGEDFDYLTRYPWPGNVRELESTIKRWMALGSSADGRARAMPAPMTWAPEAELEEPAGEDAGSSTAAPAPEPNEDAGPLTEEERIRRALDKHRWNRRKAAQALGMSYQTLRRRIEKYNLAKPK